MKEKEFLYLVKYDTGAFDDYFENNVFVSEDLELSTKWVNKFNDRVQYWKDILSKMDEEGDETPFYYRRYYSIMDINRAWISKIEIR